MTSGEWLDDDPYASEIVTKSCELLSRYATEAAPLGVEEWGSCAFEMAAPAEAEFLIALVAFERDSGDENTLRLGGALCDVIDAWRQVTHYYDSHDFRLMETPR